MLCTGEIMICIDFARGKMVSNLYIYISVRLKKHNLNEKEEKHAIITAARGVIARNKFSGLYL